VLMYHNVYSEENRPAKIDNNLIRNTDLEAHLQYLAENGFYYPSYQELYAYIQGEIDLPEKSIVLTFDDGKKGFMELGIPLLVKYQVPATAFMIASEKSTPGALKKYANEYVIFQSHSYDMHQPGGTIGHGGIISAMTTDEIVTDLLKAQTVLGNAESFAYPFGDNTPDASRAAVEAGILCSFTTEYGWVTVGDDVSLLPRVRINGDTNLAGFIASIL